jgi:hypothetical protein
MPLALQHKFQEAEVSKRSSPRLTPRERICNASWYDRHSRLKRFFVNGDNPNVWVYVPRFGIFVGP